MAIQTMEAFRHLEGKVRSLVLLAKQWDVCSDELRDRTKLVEYIKLGGGTATDALGNKNQLLFSYSFHFP